MKDKLEVGDPRVWWAQTLRQLCAASLSIRPEHIDRLYNLPPTIHKDPFDRILIAQAISESLTLVTMDSDIPQYASPDFQVIV
jgi:PIN domain nuclease of toxin-antitoxin system